jgi:hypothetical protein
MGSCIRFSPLEPKPESTSVFQRFFVHEKATEWETPHSNIVLGFASVCSSCVGHHHLDLASREFCHTISLTASDRFNSFCLPVNM